MSGYPTYRVPRQDQTRLCIPDLDQVGRSIDNNRHLFESSRCCWMDVPLTTLREWAREETLQLARAYTRQYLSRPATSVGRSDGGEWFEADSGKGLILSGHQPELFHPGVWYKNFLLSRLAEQHSAVGVNILVDHDLARSLALNVPTIAADGQLHTEKIALDDDWQSRPWERTFVHERSKWQAFSEPVVSKLQLLGISGALLGDLWPGILRFLEQGQPVGHAIAAARHIVERSYGLRTLELPFSHLASGRVFGCFVGELLTRMERLHQTYNAVRDDYRRQHRIKNRLQPIPELASDNGWLEAPFWVYSKSDPTRRPLWVQPTGRRLRLSDRQGWNVELPCDRMFSEWVAEWTRLVRADVCIRPRALTTTLFLRLAVSEFFIHGIGGGKYDQMTDELIESLWPIRAPQYMVATATLHLPFWIPGNHVAEGDVPDEAQVLRSMRDLRFSPERLLIDSDPNPSLSRLLREKASLLANIPPKSDKAAWHANLQILNARLRASIGCSEDILAEQLRAARGQARNKMVLGSREFSIAIFPKDWLVEKLQRLCFDVP